MPSHFLIGAISSGSGKTTVTLGLLRALKNRGIAVQPFKCGPDYIDTKFHKIASGRDSVNLDLFLSSPDHVRTLHGKYTADGSSSITEGVMGLFDGYDRAKGSSAEVAATLDLPVVLVLTPQSMAYTVGAILKGVKNFDPRLNVLGVIFNKVKSESHYRFLKSAADDAGIRSFGFLPPNDRLIIPSRHLGLVADKELELDLLAENAAAHIEAHLDVDALIESTQCTPSESFRKSLGTGGESFSSAVAMDEAFNFAYYENIAYLKACGRVSFFSPLRDENIPEADLLYFPGGYPEFFLSQLSENQGLIEQIREYVERGGRVLAECGGMMYLSNGIWDSEGRFFPMVGVLDQEATMENMRLKLGYRIFEYNGMSIKGHEFHYSDLQGFLPSVVIQKNAMGEPVKTKLLRYKNCIAGYTHIYWAEIEGLLRLWE